MLSNVFGRYIERIISTARIHNQGCSLRMHTTTVKRVTQVGTQEQTVDGEVRHTQTEGRQGHNRCDPWEARHDSGRLL